MDLSGQIGLHRPYFSVNNPQEVVKDNDVKLMYSEIRKYFIEMNISEGVFDIMMNTPPSDIKIFKDTKIFELLPQVDPVYDEKRIFRDSIDYGTSTDEVRRRENFAKKYCWGEGKEVSDGSNRWECRQSVMWGITAAEYNSRVKNALKNCKSDILYTIDEKNILENLSIDERYSNPISLKKKRCRIEYMLGIKK